jgi:hypothetical protein
MVTRPTVFDFAKGLYPRESRIAAAKRNAVGGKRKRCTKGKNCSAACIAAHMICLVDLPWVGSALTKAKAQIQAAKKNAPAATTPAPKPTAAAAPAATPATPAPKPAPAATPAAKTPPATAPAKATSVYTNWDTDKLVKFQNDFISNDPVKYKGAIEQIQQELDARGYQKPTIPKVPYVTPGSPKNRQGLSEGQYQIWNSAFKPYTPDTFGIEDKVGMIKPYGDNPFTPGTLQHKQYTLMKAAHDASNPWQKVLEYSRGDEPDLPNVSAVRKAIKKLGLKDVVNGIKNIRGFSDSDYETIRNAQRNRVIKTLEWLPSADKKKEIAKWKKKADEIEAVLSFMPKPQVPKTRGVAVSDDQLNLLKSLAKNKGTLRQDAMNSWSTTSRVAEDFADMGVNNGYGSNRVIYRTLNKKGSSIRPISAISTENEILTPANTNYRLYDYHTVETNGVTYNVFDMVEY